MFYHNRKEEFPVDEHSATIHPAPQVIPDTNAANSMMARELNETSAAEREKAYEDIHGVSKEIIEESEFVSKCLNEMQAAVNEIKNKPAYELALTKSSQYAGGRSTFLMFLRSTDFNPKQAAVKLVKYFEHAQFYFGDEVLGRPILYSDLDRADLECLRSGWLQMLPFRDKSGRVVVCAIANDVQERQTVNIMRATLYASMAMASDEDFQKRGVVLITMRGRNAKVTSAIIDTVWHLAIFMSYLPFKVAAMHVCNTNAKAKMAAPLLTVSAYGWGRNNRIRHRIHFGTQTELLYALMTFGIPVDYIPLTSTGELKTKNYREWLSQMRTLEQKRLDGNPLDSKHIVMIPRWTDVLLEKGSLARYYVGNVLFNQEVDEYKEQYQQESSKKKKIQLITQIYALLEKQNVRFVERNKDGFWQQVFYSQVIRDKIMMRLRSKIKKDSPVARVECKEEIMGDAPPLFLNQTGEELGAPGRCCRPSIAQQDKIVEQQQLQQQQNGSNKRQRL